MNTITKRYEDAKERYAALGVDTDRAIARVAAIPVSMHCWQGDDVRGFESPDAALDGGIAATGNYPGSARTMEELMQDITFALSMIPGKKRLNLHAIYLDTLHETVDRAKIEPRHFAAWVDYAKSAGLALDFNPTCFSHPMAKDGLTISHPDKAVRDYWVEHVRASRRVAQYFAKETGERCFVNHWYPDGFKDIPVDRTGARARFMDSLDRVFDDTVDKDLVKDALESKLFGIGAESATMGSSEFSISYALTRGILPTMDAGHYHPTEVISDKIGTMMLFCPEMLLHVSRPVRWDSDHVIVLDEELRAIAQEILRGNYDDRVHIALDYFDASINRIAAWVIGMRNMQKALLYAALEPTDLLRRAEESGDYTTRLAMLEELKTMPYGDVFDYYCEKQGVPVGKDWLAGVKDYEKQILPVRS